MSAIQARASYIQNNPTPGTAVVWPDGVLNGICVNRCRPKVLFAVRRFSVFISSLVTVSSSALSRTGFPITIACTSRSRTTSISPGPPVMAMLSQ